MLHRHKPAVCLTYTAKPNIYAGLACRWAGVPRIHNISGLGSAFISKTWVTSVVQRLYRAALRGAACVFFQNPDDRALFVNNGLARAEQVDLLPGSGVDVARFQPNDQVVDQPRTRPTRFLLSARMIREKGVQEFVDASQHLKAAGLDIECWLLGPAGVHNPSAIARSTIDAWTVQGTVRYLGTAQDVVPVLSEVDCVVLPSYREGVPRALLEASSMGLPVITTDAVGCRQAVDNGVTGMLCRVKDSSDLARCMRQMAEMSHTERRAMGRRGREKMVREFDEQIVIDRYLSAIDRVLAD
ncbi:MAG: glycosyltransferase family 4 protein [Wenzhouxiangella sp.]|nr:glycosyltransferase family 4 protein [Wenzhouxiangella sp.]